jgi:nuclear pore complex protein Nup62
LTFSLGGAKTDDSKSTENKPAGMFVLSFNEINHPKLVALATPSANPMVAVPPPSMLRGKTIEEIVNRWTSELETHVKDFTKFAGEVSVWDRALVENSNHVCFFWLYFQ